MQLFTNGNEAWQIRTLISMEIFLFHINHAVIYQWKQILANTYFNKYGDNWVGDVKIGFLLRGGDTGQHNMPHA
jgi:hypothetical protein